MASPRATAFYYVEDVTNLLGVSKSKAYKIMQDLNAELEAKKYVTVSGRVPKKFFNERFYCDIEAPAPISVGGAASGM